MESYSSGMITFSRFRVPALKQLVSILFCFLISFFIASCNDDEKTATYTAVTADNIAIKMYRYRPSEDAEFNEGRQPILFFPGILLNINEFLSHTPKSRKKSYADMELPEPLAEWAKGDMYIENDPMKYYSIAHFFWLKGYDPWFANYRGVGRGEYKSERGNVLTTLDIWATLDTPPCIEKVYEETGQYPVIGGHSTGGLVSYIYLQGAYIDAEELGNGYIPHVKCDTALAAERNKNIKGFIGLDPAGVPPIPLKNLVRTYPAYSVLGLAFYLDFDTLFENLVDPLILDKTFLKKVADLIFGSISYFAESFNGFLPEDLDIWGAMDFWKVDNTHPFMEDYFVRFCPSSVCLRALSQYIDCGGVGRLREHWKNGEENKNQLMGSKPGSDGDDYYYYDEHMYLMEVPAICIFSESSSLVSTSSQVDLLMEGKTPHFNDEWYEVPGSAHIDVPLGLNAPSFSFVKIGEWLDKVCPASP